MDYSSHHAFYRPNTLLNGAVTVISSRCNPLHELDDGILKQWQDNSFTVFRGFVDDQKMLDRVVADACWSLSLEKPPENVWFGEAKFDRKERPQIIVYANSITTRLPTEFLFNLAGQSGTDHLFGHLYAFYAGQPDYDEEVACRYQFRAARERGGVVWNSVSGLIAILHRLHKNIHLKNYLNRSASS